jgi:hypothetical protein
MICGTIGWAKISISCGKAEKMYLHTDKEVGIEVTAGETEVYVNA